MFKQWRTGFLPLALTLSLAATLTLATASAPAHAARDRDCVESLLGNLLSQILGRTPSASTPTERDNGPLAGHFVKSPDLLYSNGKLDIDDNPFFASNEIDWEDTPWDEKPVDVFVGFGTNSAWDLFSRKKGKELIIADHELGPLINQRYVLRPLLRIARSPAEFLTYLFGIDGKDGETVPQAQIRILQFLEKQSIAGLIADQTKIRLRLKLKGATAEEQRGVKEYFEAMYKRPSEGRYGVVRGYGAEDAGFLGHSFLMRYRPETIARHPEFSFLSSPEAFARFQASFEKNTRFALTDYADPEFYKHLKEEGDRKGHKSYAFSLTNIMDVLSMNHDDTAEEVRGKSMGLLESYRKMIAEIFPAPEYEVTFFFTTNTRLPHGFIRLERDEPVPVERWTLERSRLAIDLFR